MKALSGAAVLVVVLSERGMGKSRAEGYRSIIIHMLHNEHILGDQEVLISMYL